MSQPERIKIGIVGAVGMIAVSGLCALTAVDPCMLSETWCCRRRSGGAPLPGRLASQSSGYRRLVNANARS